MKLAIVHEYFCNLGGADLVARVLHELYPDAPVYVLQVYDRNRNHPWLKGMDLRPSFIQRLPMAGRTHQPFLPLMPTAIESIDLDGYDIILSSSSLIAKGVIPPPGARHISYTHTRGRVAWDATDETANGAPALARPFVKAYLKRLQKWDVKAGQRVDTFVANSHFVAGRIRELYGREAMVIPPPVDTELFTPCEKAERRGYVAVGRLVKYKRFDLAVRACTARNARLTVIGEGPERAALERIAGPTITFVGAQTQGVIREQLASAVGLLHPGLEDFGMAAVEAMACGTPVIAYGQGGARDTVVEGVTGMLFDAQKVEALDAAVTRANAWKWDVGAMRSHAEQFAVERFKLRMREVVETETVRR